MTATDLDARLLERIHAGDVDGCLSLVAEMTPSQRRAVAPTVQKILSDAWKQALDSLGARNPFPHGSRRSDALLAAVLATATLGELKKLHYRAVPESGLAIRTLSRVKREWADEWAEYIVHEWPHRFPLVRGLVHASLIQVPRTDRYVLAMIVGVTPMRKSVLEGLLADPALLENEVWRLFELEGQGELCLAANDKYCRSEDGGWAAALAQLARKGRLDRDRLLDATLSALERDFSHYRAGWFSRFHEVLQPTVAEKACHAHKYLGLLASAVGPTVTMALDVVVELDREGLLEANTLLESVGPVLTARAKGTVIEALRLLGRVASRVPGCAADVAQLAATALAHSARDVQAEAFSLVERHGARGDDALVKAVAQARPLVAATVRTRLDRWIATQVADETPAATARAGADVPAPPLAPTAPLAATPPGVQISPLSSAQHPGLAQVPTQAHSTGSRRVASPAPLVPIDTLDDLVEAFSFALEHPAEALEVERVLDAVSRLCANRPSDFASRLGPLRKRARKLCESHSEDFIRHDLARLALAWATGEMPALPRRIDSPASLVDFARARFEALGKRIAGARALPLLSAPTDARGAIEPTALVQRLAQWQGHEVDVLDFVLALSRLAPHGREEALAQVADLHGEAADALRFALGADVAMAAPKALRTTAAEVLCRALGTGVTQALWVAASDVRAQRSGAPVPSGFPWPGDGCEPTLIRGLEEVYAGSLTLKVRVQPPPPENVPLTHLSVLRFSDIQGWFEPPLSFVRWLATIQPGHMEPFFALGTQPMTWGHSSTRGFVEPLLEPGVPLGPMARLLLVLALGSSGAVESSFAVDIILAALDDDRIDTDALGSEMAWLLGAGQVVVSRWRKQLEILARHSDPAGRVVARLIERTLVGDPAKAPRDIGSLLDLLHEILVSQGGTVETLTARTWLEQLPGKSRAAKLARALLALTPR